MNRPLLRGVALALASFLFVLGVAEAGARPGTHPKKERKPRVRTASLERKVHELINRERVRHGLEALAWDAGLARVARMHSEDMARRNYFSHTSPEGAGFPERYRAGKYECGVQEGMTVHTGAENIFRNNLYSSITRVNGRDYFDWSSEEEIAERTVSGWMDSPGHRRNILTPHWGREGIGIAVTRDGKVYVTQNFC